MRRDRVTGIGGLDILLRTARDEFQGIVGNK